MKHSFKSTIRRYTTSIQTIYTENLIIGGGVVGLAVGTKIRGSTVVLERNSSCGQETSEVIHNGIYYPTSSLKEKLCILGRHKLYALCDKYNVAYQKVGKLIVAQDEQYQLDSIHKLKRKGDNLGVPLQFLSEKELEKYSFIKGKAALLSKETGIIDSAGYINLLQFLFEEKDDNYLQMNTYVKAIELNSNNSCWSILAANNQDPSLQYKVECKNLINAAGLASCAIANTTLSFNGLSPQYRYNFLKGNYFKYTGQLPIHALVYPIPDPNLNSLGVHLTLDLDGGIKFGPDTQLLPNNTDPFDLGYPHLDYKVDEDLREKFFIAADGYLKGLDRTKLVADYCGIRPKLGLDKVSDFVIRKDSVGDATVINLVGIESPGLTSSLAIGEFVENML